jgi:hypothetical protein
LEFVFFLKDLPGIGIETNPKPKRERRGEEKTKQEKAGLEGYQLK